MAAPSFIQPPQPSDVAFVISQVCAPPQDTALVLVGNIKSSGSAQSAAVIISNLNQLVSGKLFSIQNASLSAIGAPGGVTAEVFGVDTSGNMNVAGKVALSSALAAHVGTVVVHSASPYTVLASDCIVAVDTNAGVVTVQLPTAVTLPKGTLIIVKDQGGDATTNNITVNVASSGHIDGSSSAQSITSSYGSLRLYSSGVTATGYFTW